MSDSIPVAIGKPVGAAHARRLVVFLTAVFLVVVWLFVAYWAVSARQEAIDSTGQVLQRMNHAVEEQTRRLFKMVDVFLGAADQWVVDHANADPWTDRRFLNLIEGFRSRTGGAIRILLADDRGQVRSVAGARDTMQAAVGDTEYFRAAMTGDGIQLHIGKPVSLAADGLLEIPVVRRLSQAGKDVTAIIAVIELPSLLALYEEERLRPNGAIVLLRRDGVLLARAPHDDRLIGKSLVGGQLYREFLPLRDRGFAKLDSTATDAMEKYIAYSAMSDFPLLTVVSAAADDVLEAWRRQVQLIVLLALCVSAGSLFSAWRLSRLLGELAERTAELHHLATVDPMTGVNNRHHFLSHLYREFVRSRRYQAPLSLMVLDLDFFKQINDGYGHAAGDAALTSFAKAASGCLRDMDVFGRLGGEEFGVALPNTSVEQAGVVAERIREAVARIAINTELGVVRFTTSVGVTELLDTDDTVDVLLARTDMALYAAKAAGRNRVMVRGKD
ncbi:MAG: GGDEF domain-containing protein [Gammaproteobacteria bacterium]|nr:GGDEF domain-containing protein [Gammaproteobacteria bacterium]